MRPALPWAVAAGGLSSLFVGVPLHNDAPFTSTPTYDKSANYLSSGKSGSFADAPDTKDEAATDGCKPHGWGFSFSGHRSAAGTTAPAFMNEHEGAHSWELLGADNERVVVDIQPRLICGDFSVLLESARRGIGVTLLPEFVCAPAITNGDLEVLLPDWSVPEGTMHFVYPSRRGLLPGVRAFVDFLAERLPQATLQKHEQCRKRPCPEV